MTLWDQNGLMVIDNQFIDQFSTFNDNTILSSYYNTSNIIVNVSTSEMYYDYENMDNNINNDEIWNKIWEKINLSCKNKYLLNIFDKPNEISFKNDGILFLETLRNRNVETTRNIRYLSIETTTTTNDLNIANHFNFNFNFCVASYNPAINLNTKTCDALADHKPDFNIRKSKCCKHV